MNVVRMDHIAWYHLQLATFLLSCVSRHAARKRGLGSLSLLKPSGVAEHRSDSDSSSVGCGSAELLWAFQRISQFRLNADISCGKAPRSWSLRTGSETDLDRSVERSRPISLCVPRCSCSLITDKGTAEFIPNLASSVPACVGLRSRRISTTLVPGSVPPPLETSTAAKKRGRQNRLHRHSPI